MIMEYIKKKHASLFSSRALLEREQSNNQRFAILCRDSGKVYYCTDPTNEMAEVGLASFYEGISKSIWQPNFGDVPPLVVFTTERVLSLLSEYKLINGILWELQRRNGKGQAASVSIAFDSSDVPEVCFTADETAGHAPHLTMITTSWLVEDTQRPHEDHLDNRVRAGWHARLLFRVPFDPPSLITVDGFMSELRVPLRERSYGASVAGVRSTAVQSLRRRLANVQTYSKLVADIENILPTRKSKKKDVGIVLPVLSFGGVEKVALAYARAMAAKGASIHIFVCGQNRALLTSDVVSLATSITLFDDRGFKSYASTSDDSDYLGAPLPKWADEGDINAAIGLLSTMDIIINFNVTEFNVIMAKLRRLGIRTATSQHLVDVTPFGQPQGTPHQILAFEHAYDDVIVISRQLRDWFVGMGVPREKIALVQNGPGYELDTKVRSRIAGRKIEGATRSLRVLFMGRFDRQKGLDRLSKLILQCESEDLGFEWRIVGSPVLGDEAIDLAAIAKHVCPVATNPRSLTSHYEWADVMILPSRFEGVPLSILEAGRVGCIPIATRVGAVDEIVVDGKTGFLLDNEAAENDIVESAKTILMKLRDDKALRTQISKNVAAEFCHYDWAMTTKPLIERFKL